MAGAYYVAAVSALAIVIAFLPLAYKGVDRGKLTPAHGKRDSIAS